MNSINLLGRVTRDIEVRYSQSGVAVANFGLAVRRRFAKEGQQDVDFINCVAFGKTGELLEKHVGKGSEVGISGRLAIDQYEDKEGKKRNSTKVVVEDITFVSGKKSQGGQVKQEDQGFEPADEDDLPF